MITARSRKINDSNWMVEISLEDTTVKRILTTDELFELAKEIHSQALEVLPMRIMDKFNQWVRSED